jgi:hypothetical protein
MELEELAQDVELTHEVSMAESLLGRTAVSKVWYHLLLCIVLTS